MIDCCPLCGQGHELCSHGGGGCLFAADNPAGAAARTIVDEWETVSVPPTPELQPVAVTGYAINGAVLHTATAAAFRGYRVIVPVDGVSANERYAKQYTARHMLNSPGTRNRAILSGAGLISIRGGF